MNHNLTFKSLWLSLQLPLMIIVSAFAILSLTAVLVDNSLLVVSDAFLKRLHALVLAPSEPASPPFQSPGLNNI